MAVGYEGILNLGNIVVEILKRKTFHKDVAKHTVSPYSKWWLEQTDPNIMAKHPEIIWEGSE